MSEAEEEEDDNPETREENDGQEVDEKDPGRHLQRNRQSDVGRKSSLLARSEGL
jgi:hypothetical protein